MNGTWLWWGITILLICLYFLFVGNDWACKANRNARTELMRELQEEKRGYQPVMTIEVAILYGEALLSAPEQSNQERYYEE